MSVSVVIPLRSPLEQRVSDVTSSGSPAPSDRIIEAPLRTAADRIMPTSMAIKCFVCNTQTDPACNDHFQEDSPALQNAFVQECEVNENKTNPFCRKVKEYIHTNSIVRVHRECAYMMREGYDCYQKRSEDYVMDVCQCDKDHCNNSPALTAPITSLLAVAIPLLAKFM
ncbi:uncharacterized protein LOC123519897 isoform X2 [Portunus trituberculatus]|uniref:uncharacterized protein LOC123519897 isoform X2 n=1 Tax=Portunus trituberculatus TaxID=210409 RepID=UPI001E1CC8F6|nr:uncharacterized protein LOC123519897 isoform X2 [Portunus trituberculatus]